MNFIMFTGLEYSRYIGAPSYIPFSFSNQRALACNDTLPIHKDIVLFLDRYKGVLVTNQWDTFVEREGTPPENIWYQRGNIYKGIHIPDYYNSKLLEPCPFRYKNTSVNSKYYILLGASRKEFLSHMERNTPFFYIGNEPEEEAFLNITGDLTQGLHILASRMESSL